MSGFNWSNGLNAPRNTRRHCRLGRRQLYPEAANEDSHGVHVVPFLVEDELRRLGGFYEKAPDWQSFAIVDGRLVTGQNPASPTAGARELPKLTRAAAR